MKSPKPPKLKTTLQIQALKNKIATLSSLNSAVATYLWEQEALITKLEEELEMKLKKTKKKGKSK